MAETPQPLMSRERIEEIFPEVDLGGGTGELKRSLDSHLATALPPHGITYRLTATNNHTHEQGVAERDAGPDLDQHAIERLAINLVRAATLDLHKTG
jgi:hypothetical protein